MLYQVFYFFSKWTIQCSHDFFEFAVPEYHRFGKGWNALELGLKVQVPWRIKFILNINSFCPWNSSMGKPLKFVTPIGWMYRWRTLCNILLKQVLSLCWLCFWRDILTRHLAVMRQLIWRFDRRGICTGGRR